VFRVRVVQFIDYPQTLPVVFETIEPALLQKGMQGSFATMRKWRMTNIVRQTDCINQIFVQSELARQMPRDLRNL
jgi:outer membrane receptor for Fe3+-dicitrate